MLLSTEMMGQKENSRQEMGQRRPQDWRHSQHQSFGRLHGKTVMWWEGERRCGNEKGEAEGEGRDESKENNECWRLWKLWTISVQCGYKTRQSFWGTQRRKSQRCYCMLMSCSLRTSPVLQEGWWKGNAWSPRSISNGRFDNLIGNFTWS